MAKAKQEEDIFNKSDNGDARNNEIFHKSGGKNDYEQGVVDNSPDGVLKQQKNSLRVYTG